MPQTFYMGATYVKFLSGGAATCLCDVCPVYLVAGRTWPTGLASPLLKGFHQLYLCPSFRLMPPRCTSALADEESCIQGNPSVPNSNDLAHSLLMQHVVGSHLLMLLHPCFHQDEKPEVKTTIVAENLISHSPPSPVVCPSTSCHSIALRCLLVWGPPAVVERCVHFLAKMFFM